MRTQFGFFILLVAALLLCTPPVNADTVHINQDTYIDHGKRAKNMGDDPSILVSREGGNKMFAFVSFDLSTVPAEIPIRDATLRLWVSRVAIPGYIEIYAVHRPWNEYTITADDYPDPFGYLGEASISTDNERRYVTVELTLDPRDYPDGIAIIPAATEDVYIEFNSKENTDTSHPIEMEVTLGLPGNEIESAHVKDGGIKGVDIEEGSLTERHFEGGSVDADTLDGIDSPQFARLDSENTFSHKQTSPNFIATESVIGPAAVFAGGNPTVVHGIATATDNVGVRGRATKSEGTGIEGVATASSGLTTGVRGKVSSPGGTAGVFDNTSGGKILSGRRGPNEVFSVEGDGTVTATAFAGDGSGLSNVSADIANKVYVNYCVNEQYCDCDSGDIALGGGAVCERDDDGDYALESSGPTLELVGGRNRPVGWYAFCTELGDQTFRTGKSPDSIVVICAPNED